MLQLSVATVLIWGFPLLWSTRDSIWIKGDTSSKDLESEKFWSLIWLFSVTAVNSPLKIFTAFNRILPLTLGLWSIFKCFTGIIETGLSYHVRKLPCFFLKSDFIYFEDGMASWYPLGLLNGPLCTAMPSLVKNAGDISLAVREELPKIKSRQML